MDGGYFSRKMVLPGRRKHGRLKWRCLDAVNEGMHLVAVTEEVAADRAAWKEVIYCNKP